MIKMDGELDEMEMRIEELSAQYVTARSRKCRTMEEQQHLGDVADRIDEALARCPVMTEAFIRKVYLEKEAFLRLRRDSRNG
ncbi:MAG: hypothetical protein V8T10_08290 [Merdibacter sp.]